MSQVNAAIDEKLPWEEFNVEQIVSIDLGSFGFAAAFCPPDAPSYQRTIQDWSDSRAATELNKNLTAILISKETEETVAIGYEAEELYMKAQEKKEDDKYMYFEHFKPYFHSNDHLKKNIAILAADGESSLPLSDLIIKLLIAIMEHSLSYINQLNQLAGIPDITKNDVFWVISVPAIWDEMSKKMMKYCAHQAGMKHFELGLDSILSTFYVLNSQSKDFRLRAHDKIMTLDCGGSFIDSACFEIQSSSFDLSELYHCDGIRAGGLDINAEFMKLLNELLPNDIIDPVRTHQSAQWIRQKQEFALAKFTCPLELDDDCWKISFCYSINHVLAKKRRKRRKDPTYNNIKSHIGKYEITDYLNAIDENDHNDDILKHQLVKHDICRQQKHEKTISGSFRLGRSSLMIYKAGWLYLHEAVLQKIVDFMNHLFDKDKVFHNKLVIGYIRNCFDDFLQRFPIDIVQLISCFCYVVGLQNVILVGGFANSKYLVNRLVEEFPDKHFFEPRQPHLTVVKGALYWICQKKKLRKTRATYSYAMTIDRKFYNDRDLKSRAILLPQTFGTLIVRNEEYEDGHKESFDYWIPTDVNNKIDYLEIVLWASQDSVCPYMFNEEGNMLLIEEDKNCFETIKFVIAIKNIDKEQRKKIQLTLEYNHNGINMSYIVDE